jgi:hypothetical protein
VVIDGRHVMNRQDQLTCLTQKYLKNLGNIRKFHDYYPKYSVCCVQGTLGIQWQ